MKEKKQRLPKYYHHSASNVIIKDDLLSLVNHLNKCIDIINENLETNYNKEQQYKEESEVTFLINNILLESMKRKLSKNSRCHQELKEKINDIENLLNLIKINLK